MRVAIARASGRGAEFSGGGQRWRTGLRALLLASAALLALKPDTSFAQNLLQNPGFETGSLTDWTASGLVFALPTGLFFIPSHSGNFYAAFDAFGTLAQTVAIPKSGNYDFTFFYTTSRIIPDTFNLTASVGGTTVFNSNISTNGSYVESTSIVKLLAGSTTVQFDTRSLVGFPFMGIDDVSLMFVSPTALTLPSGTPTNQTNTGNALNNFLNSGGTLPTSFQNLFNLSGAQLQTALTQLDGEASTDAEKGAFELMNQFMGLMLDPFVAGRIGSVNSNSIGFAPEQQASFPPDIAEAYASVFKAPPRAAAPTQQWTAWGSGFGASSTTNGNTTVGSTNVTASNYGFAGGMDYHFTPDTLAGFALAGAGTTWNLAQGLGGGHSDAFQAGVYTKSYWGPAYVAAALAFANNWFTTDRSALGDQLNASFNGQSYGGRLETGYRYSMPVSGGAIGATPYAAIQTQWFHTPTYSETDLSGGGLGLTYNSMTANDTRSELGARFDDLTSLDGLPLILRARLAWAHDWVSNPALTAVFESLPGASFVVNGATPPANSALVSAGAELHMTARWSVAAKFDGEFANGSQTYGGSGTLRYTW
jgi:uncharacterized protein with beta-barrel porin domain